MTRVDGFAASVTVTPAAGAGCASVTVALKLRLTASNGPSVASDIGLVATTTLAAPDVSPVAEAVIVAVLAVEPAVTVNEALLEVAGTVTVGGTDATLVLLLERLMTCPFAPAGELKVAVMVPELLANRFSGLGERVIGETEPEMITV